MVMQSSSYAYIADTIPTNNRSFRFAVVQGVLYAATSIGNLGIGYCLQLGYLNSFTTIAFVNLLSCLYVLIALPESKKTPISKKKRANRFGICSPIIAAFSVFDIYRLPECERKIRINGVCGVGIVGINEKNQELKQEFEKIPIPTEKIEKVGQFGIKDDVNLQITKQEYYEDMNELEHHVKRILNLRLLVTIS